MIRPEENRVTAHAAARQSARGIDDLAVALAIDYGRRTYGTGAEICFLGRRQIPAWIHPRYAEKLDGTVVVLGRGGEVITVYRDQAANGRIRRKERLPRSEAARSSRARW